MEERERDTRLRAKIDERRRQAESWGKIEKDLYAQYEEARRNRRSFEVRAKNLERMLERGGETADAAAAIEAEG